MRAAHFRGIPAAVDDALRAGESGRDEPERRGAVDALAAGVEVAVAPRKRRDLGDVDGTWKTDEVVESALAANAATRARIEAVCLEAGFEPAIICSPDALMEPSDDDR